MAILGGQTVYGVGTVNANPTSGTVLADTGQITDTGYYDVRVIASADASCRIRLEYRNAANGATTSSFPIFLGQNGPAEFLLHLPIAAVGERFRVAMDATLASGNVCAHIEANRVG